MVGILLTLFSELPTGIIRCNISSWYVNPQFRGYGPLLSAQAQKYKDVTYLNTSPAPHTLPIIEAQGFRQLTAGVFIGTGMLRRRSSGAKFYSFSDRILPETIPKPERRLLLDHYSYGCHCLWCDDAQGGRPFIFRRRYVMRRSFPCAHLIYCPSLEDLSRHAGRVSQFLLARGMPFLTVNANGPLPGFAGRYFEGFRPMHARGAEGARAGDIAYSEGAMFGM